MCLSSTVGVDTSRLCVDTAHQMYNASLTDFVACNSGQPNPTSRGNVPASTSSHSDNTERDVCHRAVVPDSVPHVPSSS